MPCLSQIKILAITMKYTFNEHQIVTSDWSAQYPQNYEGVRRKEWLSVLMILFLLERFQEGN